VRHAAIIISCKKNFGTEKIEEIISTAFPAAKTARMDVDSIKGKMRTTILSNFLSSAA